MTRSSILPVQLLLLLLAALLLGCGGAVHRAAGGRQPDGAQPAAGGPSTRPALSPEAKALLAWLQASQRAGFERHDLPAYLAVWAPEATLTVARGEAGGPYDRTLNMAQIRATRAERFFAPAPQPSRLWWTEVRVHLAGSRATIRWIAHSETPDGKERVAEVYHLRRSRPGEPEGYRVTHNRLWPLWQMDGRRLPIAFDHVTWAQRDADVLRQRCNEGPCPDLLLAAWRFEEAWQAARRITELVDPGDAQAAAHWALRGVCAVVSGHVADAEPSFRQALLRDPQIGMPPWKSADAARRALAAEQASGAAQKLTLYGRQGCGACIGTRRRLEAAGVAYAFRDVDNDEQAEREMWTLVARAHPGLRRVKLPIVRIGTEVLISPPWRELEPKLAARRR